MVPTPSNNSSILDVFCKLATILIALCNLAFAIYFFTKNYRKNDKEKEADRKINWFKTLILDYNLKYFYLFFTKIETDLKLLNGEIKIEGKKKIETELGDHFISLRRDFTDILIAVDTKLYHSVLESFDDLHDHLTKAIFDPGINLAHLPKYNEVVLDKIKEKKTEVLKILFSYRG